MPGKSTYLSDKVLSYIFRAGAGFVPAGVWISLHTADPTDANNTATELPIAGGYNRAGYSLGTAFWSAPNDSGVTGERFIQNVNAVNFASPTANWVNGAATSITHFGIYDASSGGSLLYSGALSTPRQVNATDSAPQFAAGALQIKES